MRGFVDVHSHVVPSGDDGATTVEEGIELCRIAFEAGTRVLFATPHAHADWDTFPRTSGRVEIFERAFPRVRDAVAEWGLDLRRGWEVYPSLLTNGAADLAVAARDGDHAPAVVPLDLGAPDGDVGRVDLHARHQLGLLDRPPDRLGRRLEVHDDPLADAPRLGASDADDFEAALADHLADDRADLGRAEV